ncbi:MAG TPA: hypothetical protein VGR08_09875 [Thermomicrobiales bacterium]|nr:hypothetical protein [Thermomicrobiales bacterium]
MAYRFVLEVPEELAEEVNTAIGTVPDAQVLLVRESHGLGFADGFLDLSVAAHSFAVVERIYEWIAAWREPYPDVRLVMHDGRRVSFPKANVSLIVAAIRRDQPWVDHTMPQIGVHEPHPWARGRGDHPEVEVLPSVDLDDPASMAERLKAAPSIPVQNLGPAEQYYDEVLDLHVVGRAIRRDDGTLQAIDGDYDHKAARLFGREADAVFLENGPLRINLERHPRGLPLPYGTNPLQIQITATPEHIAAVRGRVLVYGNPVLESDPDTLRFADPFNVIWTMTPMAAVGAVTPPAALQG